MPRSLVLGVNGQDGSYVAEALLRRGHEVIGIGRGGASRYVGSSPNFSYANLDLRDNDALAGFVAEARPDFAFHFAAVHGAAGFHYEPVVADMLAVNVTALHVLLEHARREAPGMRIIYAGSSKIFPAPLAGVIDELTPARATCLYSIGKLTSRDLISFYRSQHGIAATNLILFNHESARRPARFFLPTIARGIAETLSNPRHSFRVHTLDFWIDWSAAEDIAELAVEIAERSDEGEFVLASGIVRHARLAVSELFAKYGLDAERHVLTSLEPSDPGPSFSVSLARLERAIGRRPAKSLQDIVADMIASV